MPDAPSTGTFSGKLAMGLVDSVTEEITPISEANPMPTVAPELAAAIQAVVSKLITAPATAAKQDTLAAAVAQLTKPTDTQAVKSSTPTDYDAGTAAATVTVPAAAKLHTVRAIPVEGGVLTVTIFGGDAITLPADWPFEENFEGGKTAAGGGSPIVFAGGVAATYVSWDAS